MKRVHIIITGTVQGVFFRKFVVDHAHNYGLFGWVQNRDDGSVEIIAEGAEEFLHHLIDDCHKGPQGADVKEVRTEWSKAMFEFEDFEQRH